MHAVSDDMLQWRKLPAQTFFSPSDKYEKDDWRDPFVFWNEAAGEYNMLVAARFKQGIPRRRGLTALCASKDLEHWDVREPFYAPGLFYKCGLSVHGRQWTVVSGYRRLPVYGNRWVTAYGRR